MSTYQKDPDAVLDFGVDWSAWLDGDTIASSEWLTASPVTTPALTIDSDSNSTTATVVWLSAGVAGTTYKITNRIVTTAGRTEDRTLTIVCTQR